MCNLECNAVSAVQVTHLLLGRMRAKKLRGCFVYTSSGGCKAGVCCGGTVVVVVVVVLAAPGLQCAAQCAGSAAVPGLPQAPASRAQPAPLCLPPARSRRHDPQPLQRTLRLDQVIPFGSASSQQASKQAPPCLVQLLNEKPNKRSPAQQAPSRAGCPAARLRCQPPTRLPMHTPSPLAPAAFGASLAAEVRPHGIDVLVFHPSPVATRFYDKASLLPLPCHVPYPPAGRAGGHRPRSLVHPSSMPRSLGVLAMPPPKSICPVPPSLCNSPPACRDTPHHITPLLQAHKLDAMEFFKKFAVDPEELPDTGGWWGGVPKFHAVCVCVMGVACVCALHVCVRVDVEGREVGRRAIREALACAGAKHVAFAGLCTAVFASIGRMVWRDVGPTAICFRLLMKVCLCVLGGKVSWAGLLQWHGMHGRGCRTSRCCLPSQP